MNFEDFCENNTGGIETNKTDKFEKINKNLQKNTQKTQKNALNEQILKNNSKEFENFKSELSDDLMQKLDTYKNMNRSELVAELVAESRKQKQNGNLDSKKLEEIKNSILPLLSSEEQSNFLSLIDLIK